MAINYLIKENRLITLSGGSQNYIPQIFGYNFPRSSASFHFADWLDRFIELSFFFYYSNK